MPQTADITGVVTPAPARPPELHLRVDVHDRSRVEWVATVPIAPTDATHQYEVLFEADIADAMWVPHNPWDHFQVRTRLTSPQLEPGRRQVGPAIDQLRRRALAAVHQLKDATRPPVRVLLRARRRDNTLRDDEAEAVLRGLHRALADANAARDDFDYLRDANDPALEREQALADEYVSNQVLLTITRLSDALSAPPQRGKVRRLPLGGVVAPVHAALRDALEAEQAHRQASGVRHAGPVRTADDVEAHIHRAALLKKHFQQALFLDARAYMLDQRMRNWIAAIMAMVASTFYFVWQVYVLNAAMSPGQTTVTLVMAALVAALVYAAKDRIKELGRDWLALRLKHWYADRVAHLSLQERMDPRQSRFALARETISLSRRWQSDPLNPGLGRTALVHHLHVRERLRHTGLDILHDQGLVGMKHVFRYDLSPLFVKLDDHLKRMPLADGERVRTIAGTRVYAIPIRVRLQQIGGPGPGGKNGGQSLTQRGVLLVRRRGLERFVRTDDPRRRPDEAGPRLAGTVLDGAMGEGALVGGPAAGGAAAGNGRIEGGGIAGVASARKAG